MFSAENKNNPDFNPADAIAFWDVTNRQDWDIVARSQKGIASRRYSARSVLAAREHAGGLGPRVPEDDGQRYDDRAETLRSP
jgi:hypothetical protein